MPLVLLWFAYVGYIAMKISAGEIGNYVFFLILGSLLTFIGAFIWRRISRLFRPIEKLCDIQFVDSRKRINENTLRISSNPVQQKVVVYLTSPTRKEITNIHIRFGKNIDYFGKMRSIIVNRFKERRIFTRPSRGWWDVYRMPKAVKDGFQPEITQMSPTGLPSHPSRKPKIINGEGYVEFFNPIRLPIGEHIGGDPAMPIELDIIAMEEWEGVLGIISKVKGQDQFSFAKVEVSKGDE